MRSCPALRWSWGPGAISAVFRACAGPAGLYGALIFADTWSPVGGSERTQPVELDGTLSAECELRIEESRRSVVLHEWNLRVRPDGVLEGIRTKLPERTSSPGAHRARLRRDRLEPRARHREHSRYEHEWRRAQHRVVPQLRRCAVVVRGLRGHARRCQVVRVRARPPVIASGDDRFAGRRRREPTVSSLRRQHRSGRIAAHLSVPVLRPVGRGEGR